MHKLISFTSQLVHKSNCIQVQLYTSRGSFLGLSRVWHAPYISSGKEFNSIACYNGLQTLSIKFRISPKKGTFSEAMLYHIFTYIGHIVYNFTYPALWVRLIFQGVLPKFFYTKNWRLVKFFHTANGCLSDKRMAKVWIKFLTRIRSKFSRKLKICYYLLINYKNFHSYIYWELCNVM